MSAKPDAWISIAAMKWRIWDPWDYSIDYTVFHFDWQAELLRTALQFSGACAVCKPWAVFDGDIKSFSVSCHKWGRVPNAVNVCAGGEGLHVCDWWESLCGRQSGFVGRAWETESKVEFKWKWDDLLSFRPQLSTGPERYVFTSFKQILLQNNQLRVTWMDPFLLLVFQVGVE